MAPRAPAMTERTLLRPLAIRRVALCQDLAAKPDLSFVPPLQRRRLSHLQAHFFALAHRLTGDLPPEQRAGLPIVFASCCGEDTLTRRIVRDFHESGEVSPARFSTSVYNAAPGLYSIFTGDTAAYTAVAAGEHTAEMGLLEALLTPGLCLWIFADEPCTPEACVLGALLETGAAAADEGFLATHLPGNPSAPAVTSPEALRRFLFREAPLLQTRSFTLVARQA